MTIASMMEADIDAVAGDLAASIVYPAGTTISGTCSPASRRSEMDAASFMEYRDMEFVGKVSGFAGGIPVLNAVVTLTCSDLSIAAVKYFVTGRTVDMGGVTLQMSRSDDKTSTGGIL